MTAHDPVYFGRAKTRHHTPDPAEERFFRVVFYVASLLWDLGAADQALSTMTDLLKSAMAEDETNGS